MKAAAPSAANALAQPMVNAKHATRAIFSLAPPAQPAAMMDSTFRMESAWYAARHAQSAPLTPHAANARPTSSSTPNPA